MYHILCCCILFLFFFNRNCLAQQQEVQNEKELFKQAQQSFNDENYYDALQLFLTLCSMDPDNQVYQFKTGVCYLYASKDLKDAIKLLKTASLNPEIDFKVHFFLARAYHLDYQLEEAIKSYKHFASFIKDGDDITENIDHYVEMCENAKKLTIKHVNTKIKNLGKTVNSEYADFYPLINADESVLFFTSKRNGSIGGMSDYNGDFFSDIYFSEKINESWSIPKNIGKYANSDLNEAAVGLSPDGQKLIIYREDYKRGDGNLFVSELKGDIWSRPYIIGEGSKTTDINSDANEFSACFSPEEDIIFFSSDRTGGLGGLDLFKVQKLPTGEWSLTQNLGDIINTQYDEDSPFMHADGKTLYFSSKGHNSMGGYDIFRAEINEFGLWSEPENIGFPINTTDDDVNITVSANNKFAYLSSVRAGSRKKDLYRISLPPKTVALTLVRGIVALEDTIALTNSSIKVINNENDELIGLYKPNSKTGKFIMIFPPGKNYNIEVTAPGHECHSEDIFISGQTEFYDLKKLIILKCK